MEKLEKQKDNYKILKNFIGKIKRIFILLRAFFRRNIKKCKALPLKTVIKNLMSVYTQLS